MSGLRDNLLAVREKHGRLTPELVVQEATDPEHPLHHHFEWNDTVAAEKYRRDQAAELIRVCRIKYREGDENNPPQYIRAFHNVPDAEGNRVYDPAEEIVLDEFKRELLLRDMERDWQALKRRWEHFGEFAEMVRKDVAA